MPYNWYVRKSGADTNSGDTTSPTPSRSGTDMTTGGISTTITSASANFTGADVGRTINIAGVIFRIASVTNTTTAVLNRTYTAAGSNRAWAIGGALLTINKLTSMNAGGSSANPLVAGDTIHVGAGVYRELINLAQSFSGSQVKIRGDVDGTMTGDAGEVQITAFLTNDKTAPGVNSNLTASAVRNFWAFENLHFVSGGDSIRVANWVDSTDITFTNCAFNAFGVNAPSSVMSHGFTTAGPHNILYDRCVFLTSGTHLSFVLPTSASADYDANVVIKNCAFYGGTNLFSVSASGANSFKGGGIYVYNCTAQLASVLLASGVTALSTTYPIKVENGFFLITARAFNVGTLGSVLEDYNIFVQTTTIANLNVTNGTHSIYSAYAPGIHFGQERVWGGQWRPYMSPSSGSPAIAWPGSSNVQTTDILGVPRPTTALAAAGAFERPNAWGKETTTVRTGSTAISILGPGYQDFLVPVDATSTTISVYVRWDATYAGTKPSMSVLNGTEIGVANATATATGSSGTWEQLSLTFTPTAKGIVTIRLLSSDTNGGGKAFADDWAVT